MLSLKEINMLPNEDLTKSVDEDVLTPKDVISFSYQIAAGMVRRRRFD
jgi:hypothetical protein